MPEDQYEIPTHLADGRPVRHAVVGAAILRDARGRKLVRALKERGVNVTVLPAYNPRGVTLSLTDRAWRRWHLLLRVLRRMRRG